MNFRSTLRLASLLATVTSAVLLAPAVEAQSGAGPQPVPQVKMVPPGFTLPPAPQPTWSLANASENRMKDTMDVAASSSLTGVSALAGFRFRFGNGDHKLRRIGVTPKDRFASFAFADSNGDDPFSAVASWAVVSAGRSGKVSATGGGQFEVALPGGKVAGHTLVLSGFEFRRRDGSDANVRSIGVWLDSDRAVARVMLMDDQGPDFRGFEKTIGAALLAGAPIGELKLTAASMVTAVGAINGVATKGKYRPFAVEVHYAWIPTSAVSAVDVFTGTGRAPASGKTFPATGVLQGFEFFFTGSDHHLLDIGVMGPLMRPAAGALQNPPGEVIAFQDNNRDDSMRWAAEFAILKPSAR
ncbi:MAG: hypothetical protein KF795_03015 [Labilithrix sp.]|nr:hypothetical protein [Labilithrix sp.]